jgi:RNA polymerase sigma-70 factor, ECF subfamily
VKGRQVLYRPEVFVSVILYFTNTERSHDGVLRLGLSLDDVRLDNQRTVRLKEQVERLYEELRLPMFRYLLYMRIVPDEAEEVIQESFLRLYKHLHAGGREDNLRGWVYRVAHNLSDSHRKKRKFLADLSPELWQQIILSTSDPNAGPEELLLRKEKMMRLHRDIAELSELQQNCIRLRVEGFRYREIARILNITTSTVAGSLRHAIERLTRES